METGFSATRKGRFLSKRRLYAAKQGSKNAVIPKSNKSKELSRIWRYPRLANCKKLGGLDRALTQTVQHFAQTVLDRLQTLQLGDLRKLPGGGIDRVKLDGVPVVR